MPSRGPEQPREAAAAGEARRPPERRAAVAADSQGVDSGGVDSGGCGGATCRASQGAGRVRPRRLQAVMSE